MLADVVERADVRMVQRGNRARFTFEPFAEWSVDGFDGDDPIEPRVAGFEDFTHAARADRREDLVRPEARAGNQRHFWSSFGQFTTTVIGAATAGGAWTIRKR